MSTQDRFIERYERNDTPWDLGKPDFNLINLAINRPISPCKVLDIGCGTGDNAIWLAEHNFEVFASDVSDVAIEKARGKSVQSREQSRTRVLSILQER